VSCPTARTDEAKNAKLTEIPFLKLFRMEVPDTRRGGEQVVKRRTMGFIGMMT
jgi:hypothetical protein